VWLGSAKQEPSHTATTRHSVTVVPPPIESDLGYRFQRRTLNPNPDPNPDPNPNPNPHPNPNRIFNRNRNKVLKENKSEKNDTEIYVNIELYFHTFLQGRGWGKEGPVSPPRSEDQLTI